MFDVFCLMFCWMFVMDFERFWDTFERLLVHFFVFFGKREYVKTSTACARELDFQGLEGLGSV